MTVLLVIIAFIVGAMFWASVRHEEDCPRRVLGYDCKGLVCDHRKSLLYSNMASMALNREERDNRNLWGGGNE